MRLRTRILHAWNAFTNRDPTSQPDSGGVSSGNKPYGTRLHNGTEKSIVTSLYNKIAMDVASARLQHVRIDDNDRYLEVINSSLNEVISLSPNIDQISRTFFQDVVLSMFDEGAVAIVPTDTSLDPSISASYDILALRVGKIVEWAPLSVRVELYNDKTGFKEQLYFLKKNICIVENPFYQVMNEHNSTLKRLIRKLNLLDAIDEQSGSGKLDLIIQLPYAIKTPARQAQADTRKTDIENQLTNSKYGIAYIDGTEKITQLNRPAENNLMAQIEFLTNMLYSQLGVTPSVFDGTADEKTMLNYWNRTVEPILGAITDEMKRKFLTKTARSQLQSIMYFKDPFKLVPVNDLANIADKFTRNEILSSNDVRAIVGFKPSKDPKADELRNKNLNPNQTQNNQPQNPKEVLNNEDPSKI